MKEKILEYWHISRTALSGLPNVPTRFDRMKYIKETLLKYNLELVKENCKIQNTQMQYSSKKLWLLIEEYTTVF